ncbi:MAG: threonine/serine exporter family protein [Clostridia bacterium]|nr:threonine/serine exporter family protein [Clostridia bacterium]
MPSEFIGEFPAKRISSPADHLLSVALDVGEMLLKNGAEIRRVEDTVERICRAYGAVHVEVFAIISMLNVEIHMPDGSYSTQLRRVYETGTDLYRLELYNDISRTVCKNTPPLEQVDDMLRQAKKKKPYPRWVASFLGSMLAAGGFAVFFGGTLMDGVVAALIGLLMALITLVEVKRINFLAKTLINAFLAGTLACLAVAFGFGDNEGMIMIGTIMLQIPGVAFSAALRDLLCGDVLAGSLKTVQAVLSALMIAFGYLLAMLMMRGVM